MVADRKVGELRQLPNIDDRYRAAGGIGDEGFGAVSGEGDLMIAAAGRDPCDRQVVGRAATLCGWKEHLR